MLLGARSGYPRVAVVPESFPTFLAAGILTVTVGVAVMTWAPGEGQGEASSPSELGASEHGTVGQGAVPHGAVRHGG